MTEFNKTTFEINKSKVLKAVLMLFIELEKGSAKNGSLFCVENIFCSKDIDGISGILMIEEKSNNEIELKKIYEIFEGYKNDYLMKISFIEENNRIEVLFVKREKKYDNNLYILNRVKKIIEYKEEVDEFCIELKNGISFEKFWKLFSPEKYEKKFLGEVEKFYKSELDNTSDSLKILKKLLVEVITNDKKTDNIISEKFYKKFGKYRYKNNENSCYNKEIAICADVVADVFERIQKKSDKVQKGSFYTSKEIVYFMSVEVISSYLSKKCKIDEKIIQEYIYYHELFNFRKEVNKEIILKAKKIVEQLNRIKIVDTAAGCGAFVFGISDLIERIIENMCYISNIKEVKKTYAVYAVDIDNEALETLKLREKIGNKINKCICKNGDSITEIDWKIEFKDVFYKNGGFDIVIGNPPYVGEKGNKDIFDKIINSEIGRRFYSGRTDLLYFFYHLALDILKEDGIFSMITTNYFLTATSGENLRKDLKDRAYLKKIFNFGEKRLFKSARGHHSLITFGEKKQNNNKSTESFSYHGSDRDKESMLEVVINFKNFWNVYNISKKELYEGEKCFIRLENCKNNPFSEVFYQMKKSRFLLKDSFNVNQGIVSGADKLTKAHIEKYNIKGTEGEGIFILDKEESQKMIGKKVELYDFYKNSDIKKYHASEKSKFKIIYITKEDLEDKNKGAIEHLKKYYNILSEKRETKLGKLPWYCLHWARKKEIFISKKIIAPQRAYCNVFAYTEKEWFASADVYFITAKNEKKLNLKSLNLLLNSKLYFIWLYFNGKRKGEILELYAKPLEEIPLPDITYEKNKELSNLADKAALSYGTKDFFGYLEKIDKVVYEIYHINESTQNIIEKFCKDNNFYDKINLEKNIK